MAEKNLDPTDHKLKEARKKGTVPVSRDVASCLVVTVGVETAFALEELCRSQWSELMDLALRAQGMDFHTVLNALVVSSTTLLGTVAAIFLLAIVAAALLGYWGQFGVVFSTHPLIPRFDKINPKSMLALIFSTQKLGELGISIFKMVAIGLLSYSVIRSELPAVAGLASGSALQAYLGAVAMLRGLFHVILGALIVLALADFLVQRHAYIKQQRMDFEEVTREHKENEGDPLIKSARRGLAFEMLNNDPVSNTENANAIVVNPTHFAVALFFDPKLQPVPLVCAKGANEVAKAMIRCAHARGIPVIRHVWLARTLFAVAKENKVVPRTLFDPVALIYSVVEQLRLQGSTYCELDNTGDPPSDA